MVLVTIKNILQIFLTISIVRSTCHFEPKVKIMEYLFVSDLNVQMKDIFVILGTNNYFYPCGFLKVQFINSEISTKPPYARATLSHLQINWTEYLRRCILGHKSHRIMCLFSNKNRKDKLNFAVFFSNLLQATNRFMNSKTEC